MGGVRFTLAGMMGLVLASAIGLAAFRNSTPVWASAAFSLALVANFAMVVATIALEGVGRKVAAGSAVCGWGYLMLSLAPGLETSVGLELVTTPLIAWCFQGWVADPYSFSRIAHSLLSIASGSAGGMFALWLAPPTDPTPTISRQMGPS